MTTTGRIHYNGNTPLTIDDCRRISPAIFAEHPHSSRSEDYSYIPTTQMLEELIANGFHPFSISQSGSRKPDQRPFTKHLIRLRHDVQDWSKNELLPEVVLLNSHNGTSSYQLSSGIFRVACSNGLIVASSVFDSIRVPHRGDVMSRIIEGCHQTIENFPKVVSQISTFQSIELTPKQVEAFAIDGLKLRYPDPKKPMPALDYSFADARRMEDTGSSLWKVFNRVQESLINGGSVYPHTLPSGAVRMRRMRSLRGIDANMEVNRGLWKLAEEWADALLLK